MFDLMKKYITEFHKKKEYFLFLFFPILLLPVLIIRSISPFLIIRFGGLYSSRIGHLSANTELYLCEKCEGVNKPNKPYVDIFYCRNTPICNLYLIKLWRKVLNIWPKWIIYPLAFCNESIPFGEKHIIKENKMNDRDVLNLLDKYPPHITLSNEDEIKGAMILYEMGLLKTSRFVCLLVRDSKYLETHIPHLRWDYHSYRDCNIQNYLQVSEYLVEQGYFVIRMGRSVKDKFISNNKSIIDYANSKWASDFMDIYLAAKCTFCISTGAGWDAVPSYIFRKPTVFTNLVPFGYLPTYSNKFFLITKQHFNEKLKRQLTVSEIFNHGLHNALDKSKYDENGILLNENSPEEIYDIVVEMIEYINRNIDVTNEQLLLSNNFWKLYSKCFNENNNEIKLHGEFKSRYSISYLKKNKEWIK